MQLLLAKSFDGGLKSDKHLCSEMSGKNTAPTKTSLWFFVPFEPWWQKASFN
jgi:hypothetical protein